MNQLRILVYPHAMEIGGSQLNAIELAGAVRDLGHEVIVLGESGPLVEVVEGMGLEFLGLPSNRPRPCVDTIRHLKSLIKTRKLDVLHGHEWPPGFEVATACLFGKRRRAAPICTVMSMAVAPFLPDYVTLIVGTEALQEHTAGCRGSHVHLIEPPVDTIQNSPEYPAGDFLQRYGNGGRELNGRIDRMISIVVVCRLVPALKLEGLLTAINVVAEQAKKRRVQLIIVGDGDARPAVESHAAAANAAAGWSCIKLTGELIDPRPAYAAADIVLGMGGSALRALAFGKPLVVQGEQGFWELLTAESADRFLRNGWYGIGTNASGEANLRRGLLPLLNDAELRERLGKYGRSLVDSRFSLHRAARIQEQIYQQAVGDQCNVNRVSQLLKLNRSLLLLSKYKVYRRLNRLLGRSQTEDFNAARLARVAMEKRYPASRNTAR